jgi:hypothetical protein
LKTLKDDLINHYHKGKDVKCLCHVTDALYLVGFGIDGLTLWNEKTDQQLSKICDGRVISIKRVLAANIFIIKTGKGLELVTINDLDSLKFSVQHLLDAEEFVWNFTDSLQLQIDYSHIMIATTQNEKFGDGKSSIKLMKVPIAEL